MGGPLSHFAPRAGREEVTVGVTWALLHPVLARAPLLARLGVIAYDVLFPSRSFVLSRTVAPPRVSDLAHSVCTVTGRRSRIKLFL